MGYQVPFRLIRVQFIGLNTRRAFEATAVEELIR